MKQILGVVLAGIILASCAGSFQKYLPVGAAAIGGAACIPAGPEAAVACSTLAAGVTEAVVPDNKPRKLSDDPEIAKQQLATEEREVLYRIAEKWGIYVIVLGALILWVIPDPMQITRRFRRKTHEHGPEQ